MCLVKEWIGCGDGPSRSQLPEVPKVDVAPHLEDQPCNLLRLTRDSNKTGARISVYWFRMSLVFCDTLRLLTKMIKQGKKRKVAKMNAEYFVKCLSSTAQSKLLS